MEKSRLFKIVDNYDQYVMNILMLILIVNFILSVILSFVYGDVLVAILLGLLLVAGPIILQKLSPYSSLTQGCIAFAYMSFVTLQVHLAHGLIEMHFGYFVMLAILYAFQRFVPILVGAGTAAVYHVGIAFIQATGTPIYIFETTSTLVAGVGIPMFIFVHAAYVVVETMVLLYMTYISRPMVDTAQKIIHSNELMLRNSGAIDLTIEIEDNGNELIGRYNSLITSVRDVVANAIETTAYLNSSLNVLQDTYQSVSERVSEQEIELGAINNATGQVTQAAASLSEIAAFVKNKADDLTSLKNESVLTVKQSAEKTGQTSHFLSDTSETLAKVDVDTQAISGMVEAIQGIAEQTNLLALNAAIEAARAGEQGRGFAVVADEVRALATRTHQATEEINSLIQNLTSGATAAVATMKHSVEEIKGSQTLNEQAADQMSALGEQIDEIFQSTISIASAVEEQTQINREIEDQVVAMTGSSKEMVKSIAQGDEHLHEVSIRFRALNESIQKFKA